MGSKKRTEAEICDIFRTAAEGDGWVVYPEIGQWDLLLVWSGDHPQWRGTPKIDPGTQIGIEAKLRANVDALAQCIERPKTTGPDYRAVLAPRVGASFRTVAKALSVATYSIAGNTPKPDGDLDSDLVYMSRGGIRQPIMAPPMDLQWHPKRRHKLPPIVPTFSGGEASPRSLTRWRISALRIMARLRAGEEMSAADFRAAGTDHRIWVQYGWVLRSRIGKDRRFFYRLNLDSSAALPDVGYESERDALVALDSGS